MPQPLRFSLLNPSLYGQRLETTASSPSKKLFYLSRSEAVSILSEEKKNCERKAFGDYSTFYPDMMSYPFKNKLQTGMFLRTQAESSHYQEFL